MNFPDRWIHGSPDCRLDANPPFQVHLLETGTFALRQNKCLNFEGPFLYLLVGGERALLIDTGARPIKNAPLPILETVDAALAMNATPDIALVVAHSHSHGDHHFGDGILRSRPRTTIVEPRRDAIMNAFGISEWPTGIGSIDLGERVVDVIPTPGHEPTHLVFYDRRTRACFTGDMLYPGVLVVHDWPSYGESAARLAAFAEAHPITDVLGSHIEMTSDAGEAFPVPSTFQPDEHELRLDARHIRLLDATMQSLGTQRRTVVLDDFIIQPV